MAHIAIEDSGIGTVSNTEGHFLLNVPTSSSPTTIVISRIGYKSKSVTLSPDASPVSKIFLEADIKLLNEVVIKPPDIRQLILEAIDKIPVNYPTHPSMLTGFYRESEKMDSVNYIYVSEGILEARKESYQEVHRVGQIRLMKARKKEFYDSLKRTHFFAGPHIVHRFDFVIKHMEFINRYRLKEYTYSIDDITSFDGKEIYKISFRPNTTHGLFQGIFFLEINSGAFISAHYSLTQAGLKYYEKMLSPKFDWLSREYRVNYMQVKNKWTIQNVWQQGVGYDGILKDTIIYATEFVTTGIDTLNTSSFLYGDRLQFKDVFVYKANNLDPTFWEGFTILKEDSFVQHLQNRELNIKSATIDYSLVVKENVKLEIRKPKVRLSFDWALATIFPNYTFSTVSLIGNGINISSTVYQPKPVAIGFYYSYDFHLRNGFSFGFSSTSLPGRLKLDHINFGLAYTYETTIKTRPLKFNGGLGVSSNSLYLPIGEVEGPLNINRKELSGKIGVNVQNEYLALRPSIKISLELNRRLDFFMGTSLLLNLNSRDKILFKELNGFFLSRKKYSLNTNDPSIDFKVNEKTETVPISINSLFVMAGVTLKYSR